MGQYLQAMPEAPPDTPRWTHVQPLQPMETGTPPGEAGRLFSQLLFPSAADPLAQAGGALAAALPGQDKPPWPAPGSGGPQPVRNAGRAPLQMRALAMAAAAAAQAGGGSMVQAEPAPPAAQQAGALAFGDGFARQAAVHGQAQSLPHAAAAEHDAAGAPVSPLRRLVPRPRRTRALHGRSKPGAANKHTMCVALLLVLACVPRHQQRACGCHEAAFRTGSQEPVAFWPCRRRVPLSSTHDCGTDLKRHCLQSSCIAQRGV